LREINDGRDSRIHSLLLTHSHWDHTGGAQFLQQKMGFEVLASPQAVQLLKKPGVIRAIQEMNRNFKKMTGAKSDIGFTGLNHLCPLQSGEILQLGGHSWLEIRETPGHTKCSMSFLLLPERILFPGDAAGLMEPDGTLRPLFFSSYPEYENSLRSLIKMEARALALPHNRPVRGPDRVKKFLQDSLRSTMEVREAIQKHLEMGHGTKETVEWIVDREFHNISFMGPRNILIMSMESMVKSVRQDLTDHRS
jgi:glyoxylase-like metal-dependent hydrolase (beta-lactamase superfamily II)